MNVVAPCLTALSLYFACSIAPPAPRAAPISASIQDPKPDWEIRGNLNEACTCSPPCSCNFAVGSSPHNFCWFIFSLDIKDGHFGTVNLEGTHLAAGIAAKGLVWYIDAGASQEQANALHKIADQITSSVYKADGIKPSELPVKGYKRVNIEQGSDTKGCSLRIGDTGGFQSSYIIGIDGKTPVIVENNWSWNMMHGMKAKTTTLKYHDEFGNRIDLKGTNASRGEFEWSDGTQIYFR